MKRNILMIFTVALSLPACANLNSVYRTPGLHHGNSLVLDASEYVVVNGGWVDPDRDGDAYPDGATRLVCAQPYPDSISATSAGSGLGAVLGDGDEPSVQSAFALGEAAASIGLRTQSIQLLRDQGYRLCESYLNGALDAYNFRVLQRRHQALITATLAIEQLTGAVVAGQPAVQASGSASAPDAIASLVNRLDEFQTRRANAQDIIAAQDAIIARDSDDNEDNDPTPAELEAAEAAKADAQREVANLDAGIAAVERALSEGDGGSAGVQAVAHAAQPVVQQRLSDAAAATVTQAVENITISLLEQDYTGQLCFDFAREQRTNRTGPMNRDLEVFCRAYFQTYVEHQRARTGTYTLWQEVQQANYPQVLQNLAVLSADPEAAARYMELVLQYQERLNGQGPSIRFDDGGLAGGQND